MRLFVLSTILASLNFVALAQAQIVSKIEKTSGGIAEVPAGSAAGTTVTFYYVSKGNLSSQLGLQISGPKGLEASADAAQVKGSALSTLEKGSFWKLYLNGSLVETAKKSAVKVAGLKARAAEGCGNIPPMILQSLINTISAQYGRIITEEEFCSGSYLNDGGGTAGGGDEGTAVPDGSIDDKPAYVGIDNTYGAATTFLQKDNCAGKGEYLVKITVKLNKVDPAALAQGFSISARVQESVYSGGRAASLKPVSDGMYAPRPLLLMQSIGGGQWVNLVQWKGGKPKIITKVPASPSIVFYRGFILVRLVADKLLAGGRGEKVNFELTNGTNIYNVCGKRARVRWRINGYPG